MPLNERVLKILDRDDEINDMYHPGKILREILQSSGDFPTIRDAATKLKIKESTLWKTLSGGCKLSPATCIQLGKYFSIGPERFMVLQIRYNIWKLQQKRLRNLS